MIDINRTKARIKPEEGYSNVPYKCTAGHWTIGWGWNMDANPLPEDIRIYLNYNGFIAPSHAERLLTISIEHAIEECKGLWQDFESFPLNAQEALIDVVFNMGAGKIKNKFPSFCTAVDDQQWERAANELKYTDGQKKTKLSAYWTQLHGDPDGTDDKKTERPEEIYRLLMEAEE